MRCTRCEAIYSVPALIKRRGTVGRASIIRACKAHGSLEPFASVMNAQADARLGPSGVEVRRCAEANPQSRRSAPASRSRLATPQTLGSSRGHTGVVAIQGAT